MVEYDGWRVPIEFRSDGCTFPGPLVLFKGLMGGNKKYRDACIMHDFHRLHLSYRSQYLTVQQTDAIFRRHLKSLGASSALATCYWVAVKLMRPFRQKPQPLPAKWQSYALREIPQ